LQDEDLFFIYPEMELDAGSEEVCKLGDGFGNRLSYVQIGGPVVMNMSKSLSSSESISIGVADVPNERVGRGGGGIELDILQDWG
jgi:hypothetical protein